MERSYKKTGVNVKTARMQHVVVVTREPNPNCDCCALNQHHSRPSYTHWLRAHGVSEADFAELVNPLILRANRSADRCVPYTVSIMVSCGLLGWCCQLADNAATLRAVRVAIDRFNNKHGRKGITVAASIGTLVFTKA